MPKKSNTPGALFIHWERKKDFLPVFASTYLLDTPLVTVKLSPELYCEPEKALKISDNSDKIIGICCCSKCLKSKARAVMSTKRRETDGSFRWWQLSAFATLIRLDFFSFFLPCVSSPIAIAISAGYHMFWQHLRNLYIPKTNTRHHGQVGTECLAPSPFIALINLLHERKQTRFRH